ncbi:MAG: hypothetical protein JSV91_04075, partial [Phycisphaerales bacterium]
MRIGKTSIMTLAGLCTAGFATLAAGESQLAAGGSIRPYVNPPSPLTDCVCEYHDGTMESSIGLTPNGGLMAWTIPCNADVCGWVNGVEVAWGSILGTGYPASIMVQNDPNQDGDPGDAVTLICVNVLTEQENTGVLVYYPIPKTAVSGNYFVTVTCDHVGGEFPAGYDNTASQGTSWAAWGCPDPCDPYCGDQTYDLIDNYNLPGNWMITVHSTDVPPEPPTGCPWDNFPYPGGDGQVNIDDLFGVLGHWGDCDDPEDCPWDCYPDNGGGSYGDGTVNIDDLFAVLGHWGPCPSEPKACCFADGSCQDLTETDCEDAGGVYYGYYGTCAEFSCPQPPPNDTCENAEEMQIGDTITADTTGMTNPFIDGCVVGAPMQGPTLWYYVIGDGTTLTASLCVEGTADWDHVMSVFCGNCSSIMNSNMYCAGGNDVACQVPGENI